MMLANPGDLHPDERAGGGVQLGSIVMFEFLGRWSGSRFGLPDHGCVSTRWFYSVAVHANVGYFVPIPLAVVVCLSWMLGWRP